MRYGKTCVALALALWVGAVVTAQQKVATPAEFDKTMKSVNQANQAMNKALQSGAYADAKTQLGLVRQALAAAETFWVLKKKDDAIGFNKAAVAKLEALDKALSASPIDPAAVTTAAREIGATCRACHTEYRATDADGAYIIKPGKVD